MLAYATRPPRKCVENPPADKLAGSAAADAFACGCRCVEVVCAEWNGIRLQGVCKCALTLYSLTKYGSSEFGRVVALYSL